MVSFRPGEKVSRHCPSGKVLFQSVAVQFGANAIGIMLTGVGDDRAKGLLTMRRAGAQTLTQNEKTSVVFGMPHAAFRLGRVERLLPLDAISMEIVKLLSV